MVLEGIKWGLNVGFIEGNVIIFGKSLINVCWMCDSINEVIRFGFRFES